MTRRLRNASQDDGQVLILALVFVFVIAVTGLALLRWTTTATQSANKLRDLRAARTAADQAVTELVQQVRASSTQGQTSCTATQSETQAGVTANATCAPVLPLTGIPNQRHVSFMATWSTGGQTVTLLKAVITFQDVCTVGPPTCQPIGANPGAGEQVEQWAYLQ
jgi:Tfp pilus assembly protein PilX